MDEKKVNLIFFGENLLESTFFKYGFCGIKPNLGHKEKSFSISTSGKMNMILFYLKEYIKNPAYINSSLIDSFGAFLSFYYIKHPYINLFHYLEWNEKTIIDTLIEEYNWETDPETESTWRIGDGTAAFYNYIYYMVTGFSEYDTFRSNQIREGKISREEALAFSLTENFPRWESIQWYCKTVGIDWKEVIITINKIKPLFNNNFRNALVSLTAVLCGFMGYWVLNHLPLKDFRAYKVGTNIQKGMEIPEGAPKTVVEMIFVYKVNGVNKNFTEKDLMNIPAGATFVERIDHIVSEGYKPPIHDFTMEKEGSDYKDELLEEPKLLLFVTYDLSKSDKKGLVILEGLHQKAKAKGYKVIAMTASSEADIEKTKKEFGFTFDFYFCDGTTLKTIERANPSVVVINKGTIIQKVHYNDQSLLIL